MPAASVISGLIEHSVNYWLKTSGHNLSVPANLVGKVVAIELTDLSLVLVMQITEAGLVNVWSPLEGEVDCKIQTTLSGLQKLQQPEQITALIKSGEVDIEGDVQLAQKFSDWLKQSLVYWQDILASLTGNIAAHKISETSNQLIKKAKLTKQNSERAFTNIVWDEKRLAPHPIEVIDFGDQLTSLRQDVDRLAARINQLTSQVESKS
ncbi:SCP2 domain-containing protein [Catenovulum maritimum]|uniref:Ubiquinone biosynthesis accessory factor UbiJ n=1 Tax=Catenovulum maritimum TaxID=1513271 RepID=A0A0J8JN98_9ALTE|nr:SCP2 sterol-binding domain-containing protein [Catenovulum maritimum]KMT66071.1 hypothetical protein XM47_06400 [Catenovulum maritimum]